MKILRAQHLGMCFGVRDAIALATAHAAGAPLTILGDLVHNPTVLNSLDARGIRFGTSLKDVHTESVMITAHGTSDRTRQEIRERGHTLLEATCPLVRFAHSAIQRLVAEGFHPVIVGQREHVEVRGMTGDLGAFDVILAEGDVENLASHPKFGIAAQTTQPISRVRQLAEAIRRRHPSSQVRLIDTVCQPTKQRQHAAEELAAAADIVIVIGGSHSNNTRELARTCSTYCDRVYHVQTARELQSDLFRHEDVVGITAGTSTPDSEIAEVEAAVREIASLLAAANRSASLVSVAGEQSLTVKPMEGARDTVATWTYKRRKILRL